MEALLFVLAILMIVAGVLGTLVPVLPGIPLVFAGLWLIAWQDAFVHVGTLTLWLLAALTLLSAFVDHIAALLGVKRVGASAWAMFGAFMGSLLGLFGGLLGVLIGPIIGAMLGEWWAARNHQQALRVGAAAGFSLILAMALKLGVVFAMLGSFALAWWF